MNEQAKHPLKNHNKVYVCTPQKTTHSPTILEDKGRAEAENNTCNIDKFHFYNSITL